MKPNEKTPTRFQHLLKANEKTLTRIRHLLAMAGDTSSPNEATIAARRARALIDKYQVQEWDLKTNIDANFGHADQIYMGSWHGTLGLAMAWLNDTNVHVYQEDGFEILRFEGYLVDAVTAKELWLYLCAQCEQQAKKVCGKKARDEYKRGFATGVQQQAKQILKDREQITLSDGRSLVISKRASVTEKYGDQQSTRTKPTKSASYRAGREAGLRAGLNRQVHTHTHKQLG